MSKAAQMMLRELSQPRTDKIAVVVATVARLCGLDYWRAYEIYYGRAKCIAQQEREAIKAALERKRAREAKNELHELRLRITRLEAMLAQTDPDFHGPDIAAARDQIDRCD